MEHRLEALELAAEAAEVGTWDLDLTSDVLTWSDRTKAMFGISPHVVCTMADFYAGLHPDDLPATAAAFASALDPAIRATYQVEYRTIGREDGLVRWVEARGKGLFEGDCCRRAIGTVIDITARKRAAMRQTFLFELLDRLRHLNDPAQILQTAIQALGRNLGVSRAGYGQVRDDDATVVLETCHADRVPPLNGPFPLASFGGRYLARLRQGQTVGVDDVLAGAADDTAGWTAIGTRAFVSVPLLRDGRLRAMLFVSHREPHVWSRDEIVQVEDVAARIWDAAERARAEEALRRLNASLEQQVAERSVELDRIWRLSPVLKAVAGPDGTLLRVNPAWTQALGWAEGESVGQDVMAFVAPEDHENAAAGMALLAQGTPVVDYHITFRTKDDGRRRIAWTTMPDGGMLYGFGRDITEQTVAEERLRQAQKMEAVGQLTGGLAHDFNNLLTGIAGSLELLQTRLAQGRMEEADRYITAARGAARRAAALTQRLLAFSRRQTLDPKPTDVNQLVAGMADLLQHTIGPAVNLSVDAAADLYATLVDPPQLENALLNLCINARDAMPDGGRLTIRTESHDFDAAAARERDLSAGQYLSLSVADTGTGMSAEVRRRAFDPFFTTKPLGEGTGLGLSMVYGFARQSGGQVRIVSEVGQGTTVTLYLPRHFGREDAAAASVPPPPPLPAEHGETVLVVDDEAMVRMLVCEVLEELGYTAIEAKDGASGLQVLQSAARVDLMVTDVGLPGGLNGRQLADAGRAIRPGLRVLFITGYAESAVVTKGQLEPGMQVLTKPFAMEALAQRIRSMIGPADSAAA